MINPEFIHTFLALAETKHFTKTAKRLHMTQPGVSQHLKKLEEYFGTALIHKQGKSFTLTDAGKKLESYGKELFASHGHFKETLKTDALHAGTVRFSSPGSFGLEIFDVLIKAAKKHPALHVEMTVAPNYLIVESLKQERIDVGFMTDEPKDFAVEYEEFRREEVLLVVPKSHRKVKTFGGLKELGLVNHPDGPYNAQRLLGKNFPKEFTGIQNFPVRVSINQNNRILDPVAAGLGFAILPETTCKRHPEQDKIHFLQLPRKVEDIIYKVQRRGEKLPARYNPLLAELK